MWVDAHTHLDFYTADELDDVLAQIRDQQILSLANSMDLPSYQQTCKLPADQEWVIPGLGIHPWQAMAAGDGCG